MKCAFVAVLVAAFVCVAYAGAIPCKPTVNGKTYDLTPLIATNGSYVWDAVIDGKNYTWQLQVCGDVAPNGPCKIPSPANQIDSSGKCTYLGDSNVYAWDENPYEDGVYLTYYHGEKMNNVVHRTARIYFVCDPKQAISPATIEHMRVCTDSASGLEYGGMYHFRFFTKYVC